MQILDCTLRDGGYYNDWDFSSEVVKAYLDSVAASKIDYVELGLRNFAQEKFLGPFAYTTEDFLERLELPSGPEYGVMVDAKTLLKASVGVEKALELLFVDAVESKVSLVRVAAHLHEVKDCAPIVKGLSDKGYKVGFNLMQVGGKPLSYIEELASEIATWRGLDVLYFADSLGNMDSDEVISISNSLRKHWDGDLGIHTHDNMSKGLSNSLAALENGVEWLDCTVTGMGRGAGNTQTEKLLTVVEDFDQSYSKEPVYELVIRHFESMQKDYGWGSNLLYFVGAKNNVHPTYIQKLLSDSHYGTEEIVGAVKYLCNLESSTAFTQDVLNSALSFSDERTEVSGNSELKGAAKNREVLLLGNGPSLSIYQSDIAAYIKRNKPIVIAINAVVQLAEYIDFYCISRNSKYLSESGTYGSLDKPLVLPLHRFSKAEAEEVCSNHQVFDYGLEVEQNTLEVNDSHCKTPFDTTASYAFCVAKSMGPTAIRLVGFDGYDKSDPRQLEMIELINLFTALNPELPLVALTPSSYNLKASSVYAPNF